MAHTNFTDEAEAPFINASTKIHLKNIEKFYPLAKGKQFHALKSVDLEIKRGQVFGIIGRSGAGKSTLIRLINLLERPSEGEVLIDGQDITKLDTPSLNRLRQKIGMVFQHFNLLSNKTILDNVILPLKLSGTLSKEEQKSRALELLQIVGLQDHVNKYPSQLSGGQKQRVGIARSLANNPEILLCDEATSALDPETTKSILALLKDISNKLSLTIVLITHSMDVIRTICDEVAVIEAGRLIEKGPVIDVFLHPEQDTTKSLLQESGADPDEWRLLSGKFDGYVLRLTYKGTDAAKPIVSHLTSELGVEVNILQGTVGTIGEFSYGQLVVSVKCDDPTYRKVLEILETEKVYFEELH